VKASLGCLALKGVYQLAVSRNWVVDIFNLLLVSNYISPIIVYKIDSGSLLYVNLTSYLEFFNYCL